MVEGFRVAETEHLTPPSLEELVSNLSEKMRTYDEQVDELLRRKQAFEVRDLAMRNSVYGRPMTDEALAEINIGKISAISAQNLGNTALYRVIAEMRVVVADRLLAELANSEDSLLSGLYIGTKIRVEDVDPDGKGIRNLVPDWDGGYTEGSGQFHEAEGKVAEVNLNPVSGGFIRFSRGVGLKTRLYAAPLIDREKDYEPVFSITLL